MNLHDREKTVALVKIALQKPIGIMVGGALVKTFNEDQPRDEQGRFAGDGSEESKADPTTGKHSGTPTGQPPIGSKVKVSMRGGRETFEGTVEAYWQASEDPKDIQADVKDTKGRLRPVDMTNSFGVKVERI